jgi:hypothetical protein
MNEFEREYGKKRKIISETATKINNHHQKSHKNIKKLDGERQTKNIQGKKIRAGRPTKVSRREQAPYSMKLDRRQKKRKEDTASTK